MPSYQPVRDYWISGEKENTSFGAYGYILFGRRPESQELPVMLLDAWLELPSARYTTESSRDPEVSRRLMNVVVPITSRASGDTSGVKLTELYDQDKALWLASQLGLAFPDGMEVPILVVLSRRPISEHQGPPYYVVDFSNASRATIQGRFRELMRRARREQDWDTMTLKEFVYDLHDAFNAATETGCWVVNSVPGTEAVLSFLSGTEKSASVCSKKL